MWLVAFLVGCPKSAPPAAQAATATAGGLPEQCKRENDFGPILLSAEGVAKRRGPPASLEAYAADPYTIEVCGVPGELEALMTLRCADGSQPFDSLQAAHASRLGSGGWPTRCDTIADMYQVPCPEQTYEMPFDMYMCGPGESLF